MPCGWINLPYAGSSVGRLVRFSTIALGFLFKIESWRFLPGSSVGRLVGRLLPHGCGWETESGSSEIELWDARLFGIG